MVKIVQNSLYTGREIFESRDKILEWAQSTGKNHGIVVVINRFDYANGLRERKDKLIMGCDKGGNYKNKNESLKPSDGNYTMKVRCPFRLRSVPSGIGWKVMVRCGMHNHRLDKDLEGHDILDRLKDHERKFVNDMTKYNMAPRYIIYALKDKDPENLTSITQVYRTRATYRLGKKCAMTKIQMLLSLIHQEKYMCWTRNRENLNIVADIFWTHPDSEVDEYVSSGVNFLLHIQDK
ncbi:unnamed protein product [Vicia faba]|uniref:FAR1 domain-containing protein n=1 Tax=Vicia faba TaxID=3906 RepID=A0AAV1AR90_VICFA|nr:unnamed protein product [Vicia faba]